MYSISEEIDLSDDEEINEKEAAHRLAELLASEIEYFNLSLKKEENGYNKEFDHLDQQLDQKINCRSGNLFSRS